MGAMPHFFRLRANLASAYRIGSDLEELDLSTAPGGTKLSLRSGARGVPLKNSDSIAICGGPYSSRDAAQQAARSAKAALLHWALVQRVGLDLGDGHQRNRATRKGLALLSQRLGFPVRNDIHGIDVYEADPGVAARFFRLEVSAELTKDALAFRSEFVAIFEKRARVTEKQLLACEVFASSFFDLGHRSRFISLITAVEALLEQPKRPGAAQTLVDDLQCQIAASPLDAATKKSLSGATERMREESIGQAGRSLASALLRGRTYGGKPPAAFFAHCYGVRSGVVHDGAAPRAIDLLELANDAQSFVADLLVAAIEAGQAAD
jgi:hypothetical protein